MDGFHFLRPWWLLALLPLLWALWRLYRFRSPLGRLSRICDPALLPYLAIRGGAVARQSIGVAAIGLGGLLAITALAGPVWDRVPVPVFRNERPLAIVLDLSTPMDATDITPSRLDRARYKVADLLRGRRDGQTALVIFAGDAFTVTPLTDDTATIASQLGALSSELTPVAGQRADLGLDLAVKLMTQTGLTSGDLLLIACGADEPQAVAAAQRASEAGFRVSVLGVGTAAGGPVPRPRGGLWKDEEGNILIPRLNSDSLRQIADAGDGRYRDISGDASDIRALQSFFERGRSATPNDSRAATELEQWIERGPWLLLALLPLAALAFRRGVLLGLVLLTVVPRPGSAFDWADLWARADQRAAKDFTEDRYGVAAERFADPAWKGAAWYRAGEFQRALEALEGRDGAEDWYNRGNALARLGHFAEAIAAYDQAIAKDPEHADAKYNKTLLEQAMKKKPQDQKGNGSKGNKKKDKKRADNRQQSQQEGSAGDKGEQDKDQPRNEPQQQPGQASHPPPKNDEQHDTPSQADNSTSNRKDQQDAMAPSDRPEDGPRPDKAGEASASPAEQPEQQQANEQWLRRIPDDPAGLLRRKFAWQHRQRQQQMQSDEP